REHSRPPGRSLHRPPRRAEPDVPHPRRLPPGHLRPCRNRRQGGRPHPGERTAAVRPIPHARRPTPMAGDDDYADRPVPREVRKRVLAGVLAILVGALGIHKFVLGYTTPGVILLLVTVLTCGIGGIATSLIGLVE